MLKCLEMFAVAACREMLQIILVCGKTEFQSDVDGALTVRSGWIVSGNEEQIIPAAHKLCGALLEQLLLLINQYSSLSHTHKALYINLRPCTSN